MKKYLTIILTLALFTANAYSAEVTPSLSFSTPSNIVVEFSIPMGFKTYAKTISATAELPSGETFVLNAVNPPTPVEKNIDGLVDMFYLEDVSLNYVLPTAFTNAHFVTVGWQACTDSQCFMPETKKFYAFDSKKAEPVVEPVHASAPSRVLSAYASSDDFLKFLDPNSKPPKTNILETAFAKGGILLLIVAILFGGVLLNFTPCVLPLIPVNLAILGIGASQSTKRQGLIVGSCFGLGITVAFGSLGILSVLTGTAFGTIQSNPIFNAGIAIIFCVLSLAMLDVITIDFSRLSGFFRRGGAKKDKPTSPALRLLGAFAAGVGSALLAGACVAPVLIWTLVISATLVSDGYRAGAALPLFLGLGMGLPWAFFGGGIATLPRPGKWMNIIKYGFAIVFIAFAFKYAHTAWRVMLPEKADKVTVGGIQWILSDADMKTNYTKNPKPVLLYLTADWCTACRKMARTTFKDEAVITAMSGYHAVKVDCTQFNDPDIETLMTKLGARGLPFYAIFDGLPD